MKTRKKNVVAVFAGVLFFAVLMGMLLFALCGCGTEAVSTKGSAEKNAEATEKVTDNLTHAQQTPTDIDYSLERYNLTRRAYWVNGQREKADTLPCGVEKPLGYIVLFT